MSKNDVFGPQPGPAPDFLRNTYDKQFQKLITTDFGELRPCFCKEVLPGDSLLIDPMVAIRSHPIVFPINTRIKFYCHFFYGRSRILYKDFEDFIFNTREGLTPPLLQLSTDRAKKMISTNSLGDNLGVPSTYASSHSVSRSIGVNPPNFYQFGEARDLFRQFALEDIQSAIVYNRANSRPLATSFGASSYKNRAYGFLTNLLDTSVSSTFTANIHSTFSGVFSDPTNLCVFAVDSNLVPISNAFSLSVSAEKITDNVYRVTYILPADFVDECNSLEVPFRIFFGSYYSELDSSDSTKRYRLASNPPFFKYPSDSSTLIPSDTLEYVAIREGIIDATDDSVISFNKFVGSNPIIPLSALPFRLYEFCCNYYYRNDQNNPYILDGVPQYNKFIPTDVGGWDINEYVIHHRNWESDPFTTAVPSPQYGTAPLVGLTYSGGDTARVMTNVTDSDGNTKQLGITVGVADDGTLTSVMQVDTGVPSGSLRRLMDGVDGIRLGMSINDLRNVNSFQRFLENVIRRGLRYRNQLLSHFGVSVDYPDIDIPQFIGGFSGDLTVMEVTNMSESADVALGDVAGKINAVISSNHSISIYCPEHGFVMGIFSIVPVPTYSQILPTMFTRYSYLDYFQKEFDKIGYVPIFHRNFLPLQSDDPNKILGYQRAFWDYMCSFDEVNGDFRTSLSDFVLYRQFKEVPTLNESFLKVDSESLNNIFAVDKVDEKYLNSKKFMCQFYFQYSQKTMVSKFGVASLE